MFNEFKKFIHRGNVLDLAVAVIIGAAFGKIVTSFVNDILMPPIGLAVGNRNFSGLKIVLQEEMGEIKAVTINYGQFLQTMIDFLIIALCVFMITRGLNAMKRKEEAKPAAPPEPSAEVKLLTEIRDALTKS